MSQSFIMFFSLYKKIFLLKIKILIELVFTACFIVASIALVNAIVTTFIDIDPFDHAIMSLRAASAEILALLPSNVIGFDALGHAIISEEAMVEPDDLEYDPDCMPGLLTPEMLESECASMPDLMSPDLVPDLTLGPATFAAFLMIIHLLSLM